MRRFITMVSLLIFLGGAAFADEAKFNVDGLSCPFCTYGLEKKLKEIPTVKDVVIKLKTGEVTVTSDGKLKAAVLTEAVKDAGFSVRESKFVYPSEDK